MKKKDEIKIVGQFIAKEEKFLRRLDVRVSPPEQKRVLLARYVPRKKSIKKGEKITMDFEIKI